MSLSSESTATSLVLAADHEEAEPLEHHTLLRLLLGLSLAVALHRVGDAWLLCVHDIASRPVAFQVLCQSENASTTLSFWARLCSFSKRSQVGPRYANRGDLHWELQKRKRLGTLIIYGHVGCLCTRRNRGCTLTRCCDGVRTRTFRRTDAWR